MDHPVSRADISPVEAYLPTDKVAGKEQEKADANGNLFQSNFQQ